MAKRALYALTRANSQRVVKQRPDLYNCASYGEISETQCSFVFGSSGIARREEEEARSMEQDQAVWIVNLLYIVRSATMTDAWALRHT